MEPNLSMFSPKTSPTVTVFPLSYSFNSSLLQRSKLLPCVSVSANLPGKSTFLGRNLVLVNQFVKSRPLLPFPPIRALVKRRKELPFDNVIQRDKKLKLVLKIDQEHDKFIEALHLYDCIPLKTSVLTITLLGIKRMKLIIGNFKNIYVLELSIVIALLMA